MTKLQLTRKELYDLVENLPVSLNQKTLASSLN